MKNLISMTDFVFKIGNDKLHINYEIDLAKIYGYAIFIKQTLELWMFVPCGEDGDILEHPNCFKSDNPDFNNFHYADYCLAYMKAKERCLFKGFELNPKGYADYSEYYLKIDEEYCQNSTIEDLVCFNLELSKTAIKELGL